jgi:hypothetical protein
MSTILLVLKIILNFNINKPIYIPQNNRKTRDLRKI